MPADTVGTVYLNDRRVGTLILREQRTTFIYEDVAPDRPILGQAFEDDPSRERSARIEVPAWFENLLPEYPSYLRDLIAERAGVKPVRSLPLLLYLGEDLPGAVRVVAEGQIGILGAGDDHELPMSDVHEMPLRFSLAGIQPKFSMLRVGRGLTMPASGRGGDWIVKTPDRRPGHEQVPENEFAMLAWAQAAGISVVDHELFTSEDLSGLPRNVMLPGERALGVRRFDRTPEGRVHMEDLAQVREVFPKAKYDSTSYDAIARVLAAISPPEDIDEYVRRLVAIVAMGNGDGHLKNWTIRYPQPRQPRLSPAYDLLSITSYGPYAADKLAFGIGGTRQFEEVTIKTFDRFAERADLSPERVRDVVTETVSRMQLAWSQLRPELPVPDFVADHITVRLATLPLMRLG
jgi:serine/threonine-protein kinase HipA